MKDKSDQLIQQRKRLVKQMPDPSMILAGALMSRMIRCNKPGCRYCEKDKGKGHGPIWILSVSAGHRKVRQIPVPASLQPEVAEGSADLPRFRNGSNRSHASIKICWKNAKSA